MASPGLDGNSGASTVVVDPIRGKHVSDTAEGLLSQRRLTWTKEYGWVYDVWVDSASNASRSGTYGRFSVQAFISHCGDTLQMTGAALQQRLLPQLAAAPKPERMQPKAALHAQEQRATGLQQWPPRS